MNDLVNPAASGGIDFGGILAQTLAGYQQVSMARIERDTARYNSAGATQAATLHQPQGYTMLESLGIGNSSQQASVTNPAGSALPKALVFGGLALAAFAVWKMVKR
jgi:hypothetical protein